MCVCVFNDGVQWETWRTEMEKKSEGICCRDRGRHNIRSYSLYRYIEFGYTVASKKIGPYKPVAIPDMLFDVVCKLCRTTSMESVTNRFDRWIERFMFRKQSIEQWLVPFLWWCLCVGVHFVYIRASHTPHTYTRFAQEIHRGRKSEGVRAHNSFHLWALVLDSWALSIRLLTDYFIMHFNFIWKHRYKNEKSGTNGLNIPVYIYILLNIRLDRVWKLERNLKMNLRTSNARRHFMPYRLTTKIHQLWCVPRAL